MTKVVVTNGNIDGALKKLKVKVARSGVPSELKKHREYTKRRRTICITKKRSIYRCSDRRPRN